MKKTTLTVLALAVLLTGCAKSADSAAAANADVQMRVQDGYIQYYNGTDWENLIATDELKGEKGDKGEQGNPGADGETGLPGQLVQSVMLGQQARLATKVQRVKKVTRVSKAPQARKA